MSPPEIKHEVGLRELRDNLSRYVDHVAGGGEVAITVRGRRVARLVSEQDPFAELRRRGLVRDPINPKTPVEEFPRIPAKGSVSDLIIRRR
jgi:prevent-host-death family protein